MLLATMRIYTTKYLSTNECKAIGFLVNKRRAPAEKAAPAGSDGLREALHPSYETSLLEMGAMGCAKRSTHPTRPPYWKSV
jgi:hypothetical protein